MKKLMLLLTIGLLSTPFFAQKGAVSYAEFELDADKPNYEKIKERLAEAEVNEKTKDWPRTYIIKSRAYRKIYAKKGKDQAILNAAFDAIIKASKLDQEAKKPGKYAKDIRTEMVFMRQDIINDGVYANNELKDYSRTLSSFEKALAIDTNPVYMEGNEAVIDTTILYNIVASAYSAKNFEKVTEYAPKVIETGYMKDQPYLILYDAYKNLKDTTKMLDVLKDAMMKYPENKVFLDQLVFHYVEMKNADEGIRYIQKSLDKDPDNAKLLFILGTFYDEVGRKDEATEAYHKINTLPNADDASKLDANYNLGVIYYNKAVEKMNEANEIKDYNKFKEAEKVALKAFEECVPYFETCLAINPDSKEALGALKPVYYRLTKIDKKYNDKYKMVNDKLEE